MVIDSFGYEDLIFELAKNSIEIFLDPQSAEIFKLQPYSDYFCNDENEADIVLVNELAKDTEKYLQINCKLKIIEVTMIE